MENDHTARRQFLLQSAAGTAVVASTGLVLGADSAPRPRAAGKTGASITAEADVLVIGGGAAGGGGGVGSSRGGAEKNPYLRGGPPGGAKNRGGGALSRRV